MSITVRSLQAKHSLHYQFTGRITADDFDRLDVAEAPHFDALKQDECLNIVADLSALETIAPDLFARLQRMRLFTNDRVCKVTIVGANPYLRALIISLGLVNQRHHITFHSSHDEWLRATGLPSNGGTA